MIPRKLNKAAMKIILAVQAFKKFALLDDITNPEANWFDRVESYYNSLPAKLMAESGLHKNQADFRALLDFTVTDEMLSTNFADLGKFFIWPCFKGDCRAHNQAA